MGQAPVSDRFPVPSLQKLVLAIHCYGLFAAYLYFCSALYLQSLFILAYILFNIYDQVCLFYYPQGKWDITNYLPWPGSIVVGFSFWLFFMYSVSNVILLGEYFLAFIWIISTMISINLREGIDDWPSEDIEFYHIINTEKAMLVFTVYLRLSLWHVPLIIILFLLVYL